LHTHVVAAPRRRAAQEKMSPWRAVPIMSISVK
jgi:hypothetical protein